MVRVLEMFVVFAVSTIKYIYIHVNILHIYQLSHGLLFFSSTFFFFGTKVIFFGGLLPIIMAYIVSGQVLFAEQSRKFDSFSSTLQTVFTLWNGDSMGKIIF